MAELLLQINTESVKGVKWLSLTHGALPCLQKKHEFTIRKCRIIAADVQEAKSLEEYLSEKYMCHQYYDEDPHVFVPSGEKRWGWLLGGAWAL